MEAMTAAHQTLPFGTVVHVSNLDNGLATRVRINDRGPFVGGRILDLSRRAAREIEMIGPGTAPIRITVVETPEPTRCWQVQVGAFRSRSNARELVHRLEPQGWPVSSAQDRDGLHRVRVGPFTEEGEARAAANSLEGQLSSC
jgi:rare lipoprotein A